MLPTFCTHAGRIFSFATGEGRFTVHKRRRKLRRWSEKRIIVPVLTPETGACVRRVDTSNGDPLEEQPSSSTPERPSREGSRPASSDTASPADTVSRGESKEQSVQPNDSEADDPVDIYFSEAGNGPPVHGSNIAFKSSNSSNSSGSSSSRSSRNSKNSCHRWWKTVT